MIKIIILGLLFIGINVTAQIEEVTWKDFKLSGRVKSVEKKVFDKLDIVTEVSDKCNYNSYYTEFNKKGYITKMRKKLPLSLLEIEGEYKYNRNILVALNLDWKQGHRVYEKDTTFVRFKKSAIKEIITYNKQGGAMVKTIKNDSLYAKKKVRLNRNLKVVEMVSFDENEHKKIGETNVYDKKGNLKLKNSINFFTKQDVTKKYNYDERGNPIEELVIVHGDTMKITKKYNEYNDLIKEVAFMNGNGSKFTNTTTYIYDNHYNFIEKIELTNDGKKIVTQRKIEYFE